MYKYIDSYVDFCIDVVAFTHIYLMLSATIHIEMSECRSPKEELH